jgi:hypothetical protein
VVEKFADALKEVYQSIADRSVSAQGSVNAYMDFLNSEFSYNTGTRARCRMWPTSKRRKVC